MARPGFVLTVDDRTPPLLVAEGDRTRLQSFPAGTEVVYPADTSGRSVDPYAAADRALDAGLDVDPLTTRLRPGMRFTITVTGLSEAATQAPDVRQVVVERVLERAAAAGVEDVVVLVATGVGPRLTEPELTAVLGERVTRSFLPGGRLRSHDALDRAELVEVAPGIEINRRVAESDLVLDVSVAADAEPDPARALLARVASLPTYRRLLTDRTQADAPVQQAITAAVGALGVVSVRAVLEPVAHPAPVAFLGHREWEWKLRDRAAWFGLRRLGDLSADQARRVLQAPVPRGVVAIAHGSGDAVAGWSADRLAELADVAVDGQADVLITGVPHRTPHNPGAAVDPLVALWSASTTAVRGHGRPPVREGGTVIAFHPLTPTFSARVHPSSADFYADVLPDPDPTRLAAAEARFAEDEWYASLYRHQHAHAAVLPFQLWAEAQDARRTLGQVIWVGADRATAERLGCRAASTLADALEMASDQVGRSPRVRYLRTPPGLVPDVSGPAAGEG